MNIPASVMMSVLNMSQGNPGTMNCLMGMIAGDIMNSVAALTILPKLEACEIKGGDIYILWSDLANKDYQLMAHLCKEVPNDILADACSRQDYSGRKMIEKYAATFNPLDHM